MLPQEEFVLILDADMVMRRPFIPEELGARRGTAISAYYGCASVEATTGDPPPSPPYVMMSAPAPRRQAVDARQRSVAGGLLQQQHTHCMPPKLPHSKVKTRLRKREAKVKAGSPVAGIWWASAMRWR